MKRTISEINPFSKIIHPTQSFSDCHVQPYPPKDQKANLFLNYKKLFDDYMNKSTGEGKVVGYNESGLFVESYGIIAFMPQSQIDIYPPTHLESYLNQTITFNLISFKTKNIDSKKFTPIISHREVVEIAISEQEVKKFNIGEKITGVVTSITAKNATVRVTPFLSGKIRLHRDSLGKSRNHVLGIRIGETLSTEIIGMDHSTSGKAQLILSLPIPQRFP